MAYTIDNVIRGIQEVAEGIDLAGNYTRELEDLDGLENNMRVLRTMNAPIWKCKDAMKEITIIREWIKAELKARE